MSTTNERERAQLERATERAGGVELALVVVEVAARDERGRISQFRGMREATAAEARALLPQDDHGPCECSDCQEERYPLNVEGDRP